MGEVIPFQPRSLQAPARPAATPNRTRRPPHPFVAPAQGAPVARQDPLWRELAGAVLRDERRRQRRTLAQVAERAGMSVQYLSEVERGRKDPSSEMLAAACGSLGLSLQDLARRCAQPSISIANPPSGPTLLAA